MDETRLELLGQVAVWYYEDKLDQAEIASRVGKSRSMISKMLNEVRELGFVETRVNYPLRRDAGLEEGLCESFGLEQAWVLARQRFDNTEDSTLRLVGKLAAKCLQSRLFDGIRIGVSWGMAVEELVQAMPRIELREAEVVQIIGSISYGGSPSDGSELVRSLSGKLNANFRFLPAPLIVNSNTAAKSLLDQQTIRDTLNVARQVDVAVVGIGTTHPSLSTLFTSGYITEEDLEHLSTRGAVGDVLSRSIDHWGREIEGGFNERTIGLELAALHSIPSVIGLAGHVLKAEAVLAALRGGYIDTLVTDYATAHEVLDLHASAKTMHEQERGA